MLLWALNQSINEANLVLDQEAHSHASLPVIKIGTRERHGNEDERWTFIWMHVEGTIDVLHFFENELARLNLVRHWRELKKTSEKVEMMEAREMEKKSLSKKFN